MLSLQIIYFVRRDYNNCNSWSFAPFTFYPIQNNFDVFSRVSTGVVLVCVQANGIDATINKLGYQTFNQQLVYNLMGTAQYSHASKLNITNYHFCLNAILSHNTLIQIRSLLYVWNILLSVLLSRQSGLTTVYFKGLIIAYYWNI